jgi:hypothetical protein
MERERREGGDRRESERGANKNMDVEMSYCWLILKFNHDWFCL